MEHAHPRQSRFPDAHAQGCYDRKDPFVKRHYILDRYLGKYQLAPTFVITVTREGKQLYVQATAQPRFEVFATSERDFFLKAVNASITFETDAAGRAIALVLHQNGIDQRGKRID